MADFYTTADKYAFNEAIKIVSAFETVAGYTVNGDLLINQFGRELSIAEYDARRIPPAIAQIHASAKEQNPKLYRALRSYFDGAEITPEQFASIGASSDFCANL